ncbi:MAG: hypothetical protein NVSMB65_09090 [Chloroflexota bacterium]
MRDRSEDARMTTSTAPATPAPRRKAGRRGIILAILVVAVLIVGGGVAYILRGQGSAAAPAPEALLHEAVGKLQASRSFRFRYDVDYGNAQPTGSGLIIQSAQGIVVRPSSLSAQIALLTQQGAVSSQVVETGGKTYLLNPLTNTWGRVQGGFNPSSIFDPSRGIRRLLARLSGVTPAGAAVVNNRAAWHISARVAGSALSLLVGSRPQVATVPIDVWIDKDRHTITQVRASGGLSRDEPKATSRTLTLSGYNQTYTITAPAMSP